MDNNVNRLCCLCIKLSDLAVDLYKTLQEKGEKFFSDKILRSATDVGLRVFQAQCGVGLLAYIDRMDIALLNTNDTLYWLKILFIRKEINAEKYCEIEAVCLEIRCILVPLIVSLKAMR